MRSCSRRGMSSRCPWSRPARSPSFPSPAARGTKKSMSRRSVWSAPSTSSWATSRRRGHTSARSPKTSRWRRPFATTRPSDNDERLGAIIEVAFNHGVEPKRGFELILERYGTCPAISAFEQLPPQDQALRTACAERLIRHLHGELTANLRSEIASHGRPCHRRGARSPSSSRIAPGSSPTTRTISTSRTWRPWSGCRRSCRIAPSSRWRPISPSTAGGFRPDWSSTVSRRSSRSSTTTGSICARSWATTSTRRSLTFRPRWTRHRRWTATPRCRRRHWSICWSGWTGSVRRSTWRPQHLVGFSESMLTCPDGRAALPARRRPRAPGPDRTRARRSGQFRRRIASVPTCTLVNLRRHVCQCSLERDRGRGRPRRAAEAVISDRRVSR